ncbi:hypothetical protein [Bacillus thuringiensis]|uniref:hypothetical protein n=1 Tax=Bacillus thuringiensis TaxID=1428 RepID=UPI000BFBADEE|nr:hypothetical protein [Bacillus thuringiensis]PGT89851.1 hypothetical protein COD17_08870 [Bacillus thuringiensis]
MARVKKHEQATFEKEVQAVLQKYGCREEEEEENGLFTHAVQTKVGKLLIRVDDNVGSNVYTIWMRFEEPKRAVKRVDCNPYTGKHNIHTFEMEQAFIQFEETLDALVVAERVE